MGTESVNKDAGHPWTHVYFALVLFVTTSLGTVMLNKYLMSPLFWGFSAFLFLTLFQFAVGLVCIITLGAAGTRYPPLSFVPPFHIKWATARAVAPVTICFCGAVVLTNGCLGLVDIPLFSIVRNMVCIFTVIFSFVLLGERTSWKTLASCGLVLAGYLMGSVEDPVFSWFGVLMGTLSCVFSALYAVFVKKVLPLVDNSTWSLLMYNSVLAIPMLLVAFLASSEPSYVVQYKYLHERRFWAQMVLTGFAGFSINVAFFLLVKFTSPLTVNIAGATKSVCQSFLSTIIFGNQVTAKQVGGLVSCALGSVLYSHIRAREAADRAAGSTKASAIKLSAVTVVRSPSLSEKLYTRSATHIGGPDSPKAEFALWSPRRRLTAPVLKRVNRHLPRVFRHRLAFPVTLGLCCLLATVLAWDIITVPVIATTVPLRVLPRFAMRASGTFSSATATGTDASVQVIDSLSQQQAPEQALQVSIPMP